MATMAADAVFLDTNVLVYANQATALRHAEALALLRQAEQDGIELWISGQVLREYLAVVTRPQGDQAALSMQIALDRVRRFTERFQLAEDGPLVRVQLFALLASHPTGGRQVHDANIVATMLAHGLRRLLTFNVADFQRYEDVIELAPPVVG
jgi:predicted nucleic acid-binding protein